MEHFDWLKGFVFPYINFLIFIFLAFKFFKKPILTMVANKRTDFEAKLNEANAARTKAEERNRELANRIATLDAEIAKIDGNSRANAEARAEDLVKRAETLSVHLREEAKRITETELARTREALRKEILAEVKSNVANKIRTELADTAQKKLVHGKLSQLSDLRVEV